MENKKCSFFGHREISLTKELYATVSAEIEKAVDFGCRTFYFGGYGEFDGLCYKIVTELRAKNPALNIKRVYCVPLESHLRKRVRYFNPEDYEETVYLKPAFDWWYKSIYYRNLAMIDDSDYIIFYADSIPSSGAYKAYKYAQGKSEKTVINLFGA